jgi:hypothetical protein
MLGLRALSLVQIIVVKFVYILMQKMMHREGRRNRCSLKQLSHIISQDSAIKFTASQQQIRLSISVAENILGNGEVISLVFKMILMKN